jgi:menaquinone-dependent protoporphyrinogen oxidase
VWLFSSAPVGPGGESGPADADTLAELTGAREHRVFAGRLDRQRLGLGERLRVRLARVPARDDRDWGAVEEFAADIADALSDEVDSGAGGVRVGSLAGA